MKPVLILAQEGSQRAGSILQQAFELSDEVQQSWNFIWQNITDPENQSDLWVDIVNFSLTIAFFALIYMFVRYGNEVSRTKYLGTVIEMFLWPISVIFLLGRFGSGTAVILSQIIGIIRGVNEELIQAITLRQLAGITLGDAVEQVQLNQLGTQRLYQLTSECQGLVGDPLQACLESKEPEINGIVDGIAQAVGGDDMGRLNPLGAFVENVLNLTVLGGLDDLDTVLSGGGFTQLFQDRLYPLVQSFLYVLQWAFLNMVESALFLTALLAPLAVVLSLLPVAGKPFWAWITGFLSLYALKLGYTITVGIIATVIVNTEGETAEIALGYGFIFFTAVFSPIIATLLAGGGGVAVYQGIARRAASLANAVSGGVSTVVTGGLLKK